MGSTSWAATSVGDLAIETLQKGLTVGAIATKRVDFETCAHNEELASVIERNRRKRFDFLPVISSPTGEENARAPIVGLLEIAPFMDGGEPSGLIRDRMQGLSEDNLIGADASILTFIRDADHQRCRLVVAGHEISGLVSLSDLQQLPVRAALFGLITHLEIIMTNAIRAEFDGTKGWLERLAENRRRKLEDEIDKADRDNDIVDALLFTQFADKVTIIGGSPRFHFGKGKFERELKPIENLRNLLAHANDYAATPVAASNTCRIVRLIDKWRNEISGWPLPV